MSTVKFVAEWMRTYDVEVGFLAALHGSLETQGTLTMESDPAGVTDDPATGAADDPTVIPVSTTPYPDRTGYVGPWPTVALVGVEAGGRVAVPTGIGAEASATEGEEIVFWQLTLRQDVPVTA